MMYLVERSDSHIYHALRVAQYLYRLYSLYSLVPIFTKLFLKRTVLQNYACKSYCYNYEYVKFGPVSLVVCNVTYHFEDI
jgi:hypothetical protein